VGLEPLPLAATPSPEASGLRADAPPPPHGDRLPWGDPGVRTAFRRATDHLSVRLYATLARRPGNLIFSPPSITTALAVVYGAARGSTASEIDDALDIGVGSNWFEAIAEGYWADGPPPVGSPHPF
jgi:hypothetical protein